MNEMYEMSIVTHYYSVIGILMVIFVNAFVLIKATELIKYKRQMSIFTPIGSLAIGGIIFTGVVMMAAKHLDFTLENIIMIAFAIAIIVLEVKRAKSLKYMNPKKERALEAYKPFALRILQIEFLLTITISIWMWI